FLDLAQRVGAGEDDVTVWQALAQGLSGIDDLLSDDVAAATFRSRVGALANPALDRIGRTPDTGDDDRTRELRATLVRLLGRVAHDPDIVAAAPEMRDDDDPTLAAAALAVVAHHGGADEYADVRRCWKEATDPQQEQRHLRALAEFRDPALTRHLLDEILEGGVRSQDGPYVIRGALRNRAVGPMVWEFVMTRWDEL
ncbi:MAG: hypothetical protein GWN79_28665, partial [Actinobacteria bacterium]|nr:hypothetical protein [Actinomycetota bacterium]NIS37248.1 hypothetical protein [Actinomycetota bacterium]NIT99163.1 hypothetical protein [Actinomycetota bacterium]NIU22769.1 hypothetical protein [Actinomycetota bacterium]NIU71684.1 hypothetical protein [Actinomycetota bacterium]